MSGTIEPREALTSAYAYGRVALGVTALALPGPVARGFGLGSGSSATLAGRYIGGRDLVAGVGMLLGRRHGAARGWYEAAAVTDALDVGITLVAAARGTMPARRAALVAALAGASAAAGFVLARSVDDRPAAPPDVAA